MMICISCLPVCLQILDLDNDGIISPEELQKAVGFLREQLGEWCGTLSGKDFSWDFSWDIIIIIIKRRSGINPIPPTVIDRD